MSDLYSYIEQIETLKKRPDYRKILWFNSELGSNRIPEEEINNWFEKNFPSYYWVTPTEAIQRLNNFAAQSRAYSTNNARNIQGQAYRPASERQKEELAKNLAQDVQNKRADIKTWLDNLIIGADQSVGDAARVLMTKLYGGQR